MDSNIRNLIHVASGENNAEVLNEAYVKLKSERQTPNDRVDAVLPDLFILCAETAFKVRSEKTFIFPEILNIIKFSAKLMKFGRE